MLYIQGAREMRSKTRGGGGSTLHHRRPLGAARYGGEIEPPRGPALSINNFVLYLGGSYARAAHEQSMREHSLFAEVLSRLFEKRAMDLEIASIARARLRRIKALLL